MTAFIEGRRYNLGAPVIGANGDPYRTRQIHGVAVDAVYYQPRSRRVIVETESIWEDRNHPGCCVGTRYHLADADEIARLIEDGADLPEELVPAAEGE